MNITANLYTNFTDTVCVPVRGAQTKDLAQVLGAGRQCVMSTTRKSIAMTAYKKL